jgi:hypothetical protein
VRVNQATAQRGKQLEIEVIPFHGDVKVFFNGRPMPKKVYNDTLVVTIPSTANSGYFEVEWQGRRYRSNRVNVVP